MEELQVKIISLLQEKDTQSANNYMLQVCKIITEESTESTIDAHINLFFNEEFGVKVYLNQIFQFQNVDYFSKLQSIPKCFEVIFMLLNNFPKQMEDYYQAVIELCYWKMGNSKRSSSNVNCAEILYILVTSDLIEISESDLLGIYSKVKKLILTSKSSYLLEVLIRILAAFPKYQFMKEKCNEIAKNIVKLIKGGISRKTGAQNILQGGYTAIDVFMKHAEFEEEELLEIYKLLKRDVVFDGKIYRRQGNRTCVQFVINHADMFTIQIQKDIEFWSKELRCWCTMSSDSVDSKADYDSSNYHKSDSSVGFAALNAVYKAVCQAWSQAEQVDEYFEKLLDKSKKILETKSHPQETKLAVDTIGYMAIPASKCLSREDFLDLFIYLLQKIEFLLMEIDSSSKYISGSSCDYVEAIAPFFKALKHDINEHINIFKRLTIIMIKLFPKINSNKHQTVVNTVKTICLSVLDLNKIKFHYFLEDIVKQGVLWTCSHKLAQEVELYDLNETTYLHYIPLWKSLLKIDSKRSNENEFNNELYDQLMENLIYMSNKLNLKIVIKEEATQESEDLYHTEKCKDFVIFANLTDFYCELLECSSKSNFKRWINTVSNHLIRKSMQEPLVSGFYKLLSSCMKVCEDIDFFCSKRLQNKEHVRIVYENVKTFLEHILKKITHYKGELQLSCVLLILHTPISIIKDLSHDFSRVFITAFQTGQHKFSLAFVALNTLEKWYKELDIEMTFPLLKKTVPCLDAYLRNQFVLGDSYHVQGRKLKKYRQRKINIEEEPELVKLQHKVLKFLAIMPNDIIMELSSTSSELKLNHGEKNLLSIKLSFGEMGLTLWMDLFLDRIIILSIECTDRKIRITACELLHALVSVFLGTSVVSTSNMEPILEKLLKAIVKLSCDQDSTVVSLFKPLLLQLAHWFAHPKQIGSTYSHAFIKVLMEGVTSPNDGAVRDQIGCVLKEFVAWTRRQNTKTTLKKNLYNIQLIIDYLSQFCLHPDEAKRYGSTVIFNNIYRELREEDIMIERFWLEILYAFVMNLSLVKVTDNNDDLLTQINLCLDRVNRCLMEKAVLFQTSQSGNDRTIPPKFTGNTLKDVAVFLAMHSWHINIHCRTKCIDMFRNIPITMSTAALDNADIQFYMHDLQTIPNFQDLKTIEDVLKHYASLTCLIDGYIFLTEANRQINVDILWNILYQDLTDFKLKNLEYIRKLLNVQDEVLLRRTKDEFTWARSKLAEKIFQLFEVLLMKNQTSFFNEKTWALLADYLFNYQALGLTNLSKEKWEMHAMKLLKLFLNATKNNPSARDTFTLICQCGINNMVEWESSLNADADVPLSRRQFIHGLLVLRRSDNDNFILKDNIFMNTISVSSIYELFSLQNTQAVFPKLKDTRKEYFSLKLELALEQTINAAGFEQLISCLCNNKQINVNGVMEEGYYFFTMFKKLIFKYTATEDKLYNAFNQILTLLKVEASVRYFRDYLKYFHKYPVALTNGIRKEIINIANLFFDKISKENRCTLGLELIHEIRLVIEQFTSEGIREFVIKTFRKKQPTALQQIQHFANTVKTLGLVSPYGCDPQIQYELKQMKKKYTHLFKLETSRTPMTLLIKSLFETTYLSNCLNFFIMGVDLNISFNIDFDLDASFCQKFMKQLPLDLQNDLVNQLFELENHYDFQKNIIRALTISNLLAFSSYEVFKDFYIRYATKILDTFSLESFEDRAVSCIFISRLFGNIKVELMESRSCSITQAVCGDITTGKELIEKVCKMLYNVCKEPNMGVDPQVFRLYQCYGYNALATVTCNALKGKSAFYEKLFVRLDKNEDILWSKFVPLDKDFNFEIEVEDLPKKKKILVDICSEVNADIEKEEYIESHNLFLSTLSEDVTNYDFTNLSVRHKEDLTVVENQKSWLFDIDQEDINSHECMPQICAVIKHMYENEMLTEKPPNWVNYLNNMLLNSTIHKNVRQFLCKVFDNSKEYLKQYASIFTFGIIRTIIDTCDSINSLACDLIVMLLTSWKNPKLEEASEEMNELIHFIISHLWNERSDVFKYNVSILRTVVETYNSLTLKDNLIESLFKDDNKDKSNLVPIHVVNILLVNNINPFKSKIKQIARRMIQLLESPDSRIYKASAETIGLTLKFLDDLNHPSKANFVKLLTAKLNNIPGKEEKKVSIMESIVKNFAEFGSEFLDKTFVIAISSENQNAYLRIFLKCIDQLRNSGAYNYLKLSEKIKSTHLDTQILAFEVTLRLVDSLDTAEICTIAEVINTLPNIDQICKSVCTDIMISIYKRFYGVTIDNGQLKEMLNNVKTYLINGFVDVEPEIRQKISTFWTESDIFPQNLESKMIHLLQNMYDCRCEDIYLPFCNLLLLDGLKDNGEAMFKPLHNCEFRKFEVTAHWRAMNASMMPMFTQSVESQYFLQATQSYNQFDQTQMLATQRQSYIETASVLGNNIPLPNSLTKSEFKHPSVIENYKIKSWRFYKKKSDVSKMHAIRELKKGQEIDKMREDVKKKKEVQVDIYRSYRTGDFPDVEITIKSIVDPLKALTKKDAQIAQILYKSLFDSIINIATDDDFMEKANDAITNIFTTTTTYNPAMIGAFLHIALQYKDTMTLHPNLIKTVANKSGALSYGCLLLEEYLQKSCASESSAKRGIGAGINDETMHWLKLAELYKSLKEWDVVNGMFRDKIDCPNNVLMAIHAESENYWAEARELYRNLIKDDYDVNRKDFYYEAFFKCSEELSDWKDVVKRCKQAMHVSSNRVFNKMWSNDWYKETLLPHYFKAQVRLGDTHDLLEKVKEFMKDNNNKDYLQNEFADELAYLYLDNSKKKSLNYASIYAKNFLNDWKFVKPFYSSLQNTMLLNMKNCMEIARFFEGFDALNSSNFKDVIKEFINIWHKCNANDNTASTPYLTTKLFVRDSFTEILKIKLNTLNVEIQEQTGIINELAQISFNSEVKLIDQAIKQRNFALASKYSLKIVYTKDANGEMYPVTFLLYSRTVFLKAKMTKGATLYADALRGYYKCVNNPRCQDDPTIIIPAVMHLSDLCKSLVETAEEENWDLGPIQEIFSMYPINCFADILTYVFENMRDTLYRLDESQNKKYLADAFLKLAKEYANKGEGHEDKYIECSLKSIEYGSDEAILLFPNLLDVKDLVEVHKEQFIQQTSKIPIWKFICWIPQLLAYIDTAKVSVIKHLVIKIATEYPNAIIYSYKLSRDKYTFKTNGTREVIKKLDELLQNDLIEKMLQALKYVCVPSVTIRTALAKLKKACDVNEAAFKRTGEEVVADLFTESMDTFDALNGNIHKSVLKNKPKLLSIINHSPFNKEAINKKIEECANNIIDERKDSVDLGHYSPWLKYFHASNYEQEIEIPGCYTGNSRPLPHYHPKISKFSPDVTVFRSLRKPIRLTIFANDVKEYRFLVKYGEDLRLDQRIQQLFKLMNVMLSSDSKCHERKLQVSTFEVIPLTGDLGFIQWVDETEILKNLITKNSGYKTIDHKINLAREKYTTWNEKAARGDNNIVKIYSKALLKYDSNQTKANYNQIVNILPWDALRKAFWNISPDPETFFALRQTFTRSYAVMCICNWVLGIGDRHLQNILISVATGQAVGIDFGHAFGSGTHQQSIPELVPFRLTPQLVNLMLPFKESGLIYQTMVHTLRTLRENYEALLSTMNIFILEPSLNWNTNTEEEWNPNVILNLAKAKFTGKNPFSIMIDEIKMRNKDSRDVNAAYVKCLEDSMAEFNFNEKLNELSVNDQVTCLLTQATDANLLGRMYVGWEPWI